ncbi:hypothetical protein CCR75_000219 [Bremia lactucae]|uniref:Uncharacterized protein n=1 Tax=Bremia lactucae TaxID=4779 RepID=A0A976IAC9_BRELC|nr:hypothetical protein CCR75_000219 [Bremia lactucae]
MQTSQVSSTPTLSTLSATLLASLPTNTSEKNLCDVDYANFSLALKNLHIRAHEEIAELVTVLHQIEPSDSIESSADDRGTLAVHDAIKLFQRQLALEGEHFSQLESIVRPRLSKLQRLQSRAKYLEMAVEVEHLSHEANKQALKATPDALEALMRFVTCAAAISEDYLLIRREAARRVEDLYGTFRQHAVEKLQLALVKIQWPEPLTTQQELVHKETDLRDVATAFAYLLSLQLAQQSEPASTSTDLWAMDCVLDPLLLRFRFHFERISSATNRLAKPEWYLHYVLDQTKAHTRFFAQVLTPVLHRHREQIHCWDAQILVLRGFVRAACRKLTQDLPTLLAHSPLLCHTMDEVLQFERSIDEEIGYESWATADRQAYPRCIDVFTSENDVLFAWTSVDVEYAHHILTSKLHDKPEIEWYVEDGDGTEHSRQDSIPPLALRLVTLVDFLSQRFLLIETDEMRYLYVMQVHLPLLSQFMRLCEARGRRLIASLTETMTTADILSRCRNLFLVGNALQHVAQALAAWEQSSVFLELSRKVTGSRATQAHVLQMHMAYSKQVLARASAAVLATEEATAVRQALAGPGAMIGPAAALTAAYSAGSKTMKSLFRRNETKQETPSVAPTCASTATTATNDKSVDDQDDAEALLFTHTIFERPTAELKMLASTLLEEGKNTLMHVFARDMETYRSSPFWTETSQNDIDENQLCGVSAELGICYEIVSIVLSCAQKVLLPECWLAFWKPFASGLDDALFDAFYNPAMTEGSSQLGEFGKRRFIRDIKTMVAIFTAVSSKALPSSSFRRTREVCLLLEIPTPRLREIYKALKVDETRAPLTVAADPMEQLTTILEACRVFCLTPAQVVRICTTRLNITE